MKIEDAKILVVDDDQVMTMFIVNMLTRLGVLAIGEAVDGKDGLAKVASFRPDVVLTDIHMATMNGIEFVRQLRTHPTVELRKTPVLIMSADSSTEKLNDSLLLGVAGYIIKPPIIAAMKTKLEHALKFR
jgi:CheY-like chemotaxis protein